LNLKNNWENKNFLIGFHVSIKGSLDLSVDRAAELGCTVFQIFTTNPRSWRPRVLTDLETEKFNEKRIKYNFQKVFSHMPYLPNLASPKIKVYDLSVKTLLSEVSRCMRLNIPFLVTHLGSHLGEGYRRGVKRIIDALNQANNLSKGKVKILLENTAGSPNSIGSKFEHIGDIINGVQHNSYIGFCFDTCHGWAAGYDIKTVKGVNETVEKLDNIIGLKKVYLIHLNDSVGGLGSHIDRHEHIGLGSIGLDGFKNFLRSCLSQQPLIMETPIDERRSDLENLLTVKKIISEL
jgi:deoxyribonuclease-4